jgi:hypothetical protein
MCLGRWACHVTLRAAHRGHSGTRIHLPSKHIRCQRPRSSPMMTGEATWWASSRRSLTLRKDAPHKFEKSLHTCAMQILQCTPTHFSSLGRKTGRTTQRPEFLDKQQSTITRVRDAFTPVSVAQLRTAIEPISMREGRAWHHPVVLCWAMHEEMFLEPPWILRSQFFYIILHQRDRGMHLTAGVRRTPGMTKGRPGVQSTSWRAPTRSTACTPAWTRRARWAYEHRPRSATSTSPAGMLGWTACTWARS